MQIIGFCHPDSSLLTQKVVATQLKHIRGHPPLIRMKISNTNIKNYQLLLLQHSWQWTPANFQRKFLLQKLKLPWKLHFELPWKKTLVGKIPNLSNKNPKKNITFMLGSHRVAIFHLWLGRCLASPSLPGSAEWRKPGSSADQASCEWRASHSVGSIHRTSL